MAPLGGDRPSLTAAAIACLFSAGEYKDELVKKWLKYCQTAIPLGLGGGGVRIGHDEYTHYYYAQAVYILGDDGWEKLFGPTPPDARDLEQVSRGMFDQLDAHAERRRQLARRRRLQRRPRLLDRDLLHHHATGQGHAALLPAAETRRRLAGSPSIPGFSCRQKKNLLPARRITLFRPRLQSALRLGRAFTYLPFTF